MNDGENSPEVIAARAEAEAAIKEEKAASMESLPAYPLAINMLLKREYTSMEHRWESQFLFSLHATRKRLPRQSNCGRHP